MEKAVLYFVVLGIVSGFTEAVLNATAGQSVRFIATMPPSEELLSIIWTFDNKTILNSNSSHIFVEPEYEDRINFYFFQGSLTLREVNLNDSGEYRFSVTQSGGQLISGSTRLEVYEFVFGVSITTITYNPPAEGYFYYLACNGPTGSRFTREWKKDGEKLNWDFNIDFTAFNHSVYFQPLKPKDSGIYSCNVSNDVSSEEATYNLTVYYGPDNAEITGPSEVRVGHRLTLTCSVNESSPSARYTWTLNDIEIHNSSVFTKDSVERSDNGNYTCQAWNPISEKTISVHHSVSVTAPDCSVGCIAGVVVACLVVAAVVGGGGGYYIYKKKVRKYPEPKLPSSDLKPQQDPVLSSKM